LFAAGFARGQTSEVRIITLEEAISIALSGNRDLASLELDLNGRVLSAESARYQFAYNLGPVAGAIARDSSEALRYGVVGSKEISVGTEFETGIQAVQTDYEDSDMSRSGIAHFQVSQPLFRDWGKLVNQENIVQADSRVTAARRVLELRKSDLIVQIVETCQGLLRYQRLIADEQISIDRYERLYRLTRAREKQGRATQVDRLRVELFKGQAESRKASSEEQLRSLQAEFSNQLGVSPDQLLMPAESADLRLALPERNDAIRIALSNRLDYAQALQDQVDTKRGMRIAQKQLQPRAYLVARYERLGEGIDWGEAWAFDQDGWNIALSTDSDFFLREERLGVRQAGLDETSAALRIEEVDALIRRQIDQALSACRRAESEQDIAQRNVEVASQRANLAQRLFDKGRVDHTSATDAEIELLDARTKLLNARAEAVIAGYKLLRMMGILVESPEDLKPASG